MSEDRPEADSETDLEDLDNSDSDAGADSDSDDEIPVDADLEDAWDFEDAWNEEFPEEIFYPDIIGHTNEDLDIWFGIYSNIFPAVPAYHLLHHFHSEDTDSEDDDDDLPLPELVLLTND